MKELKKVTGYSIKYLETSGIIERHGRFSECGKYISDLNGSISNGTHFFESIGSQIFLTKHEALVAASNKLEKKIKSLTQKIEKIRKQQAELK